MRAVGLRRTLPGRTAGRGASPPTSPMGTAAPQGQRRPLGALHRGSLGSSEALLTPAQRRASPRPRRAGHRPGQGGQGLLRPHRSERLLGAMARCGEPPGQRFLHAVRASVGARRRCAPVDGGGRSRRAVARGLRARRRDCAERRCSRWECKRRSPAQVPARCRGLHRGAAGVGARAVRTCEEGACTVWSSHSRGDRARCAPRSFCCT